MTLSMKVLADEIYRLYEFWLTVGETVVCHRAPYKRVLIAFDEIDLCGLLMVIAMNLNSIVVHKVWDMN